MNDATKSAFDVLLSGVLPVGYMSIFQPLLSANVKTYVDDIFIFCVEPLIPLFYVFNKNEITGKRRCQWSFKKNSNPPNIHFWGCFDFSHNCDTAFASSILYLVMIPADDIYVKIGLNIDLFMLLRLPEMIEENPYNKTKPDDKVKSDDKKKLCLKNRGLVSVVLFGIDKEIEKDGEEKRNIGAKETTNKKVVSETEDEIDQ
ncbi:hypothetical protein C2G38_2241423 [Gigaspora rosea]|uniref:Uncharacterized protein n=1 Tax=Gigaspora rosea TaxID=44941 RepID=A0A397VUF5_9GLOM|nr:hypothetical protein C2G38_2241423 [Gigaspora rosea]CAG8533791.1 7372_t:CDS:2 [Gigaspora rosea]